MTEVSAENFFESVGGGGAPSQKLIDINDGVIGTIVSQRIVDYIPFGKTEPDRNKDGSIRKQLVVTLQTDQRDWAGIKPDNIPRVNKDDRNSARKDPSEDDGKRNIYLPQWSNIQAAVAEVARVANGPGGGSSIRDGGKLGVKVVELKEVGKGNPLKIHKAVYEKPSASEAFFDQGNQSAPVQQQSPPTGEPSYATGGGPATNTANQPPAQQDPWGSTASQQVGGAPQQRQEPPF